MRRALLALLVVVASVTVPGPAAADPLTVITVGTSIEYGTGHPVGESWPQRLADRAPGVVFGDNSLPGGAFTAANSEGVTIGMKVAEAAALHPDVLVIGGPVNDLVRLDVSQIGNLNWAVYNAVAAAYNAGVPKVIVMGILPFTDGGAFQAGWWPTLEQRRQAYNTWARDMWGGNYVDLSWWLRETTSQRGDYRWFRDGLHLTRIGAALTAEAFPVEKLEV